MLELIHKLSSAETAENAGKESADSPEITTGRQCCAFSEAEDKAIETIKTEAKELFSENNVLPGDYALTADAAGNLYITFFGEDPSKTVFCGSHADSVQNGGKYDGTAGLNSAFNYLKKLVKKEQKPRFNYGMVVFRAEESSPKTGVACLGSRIATGTITKEELEQINYKKDNGENVPLKDFLNQKYGPETWNRILNEIKNPMITPQNTLLYEELHIEQSGVCELNGADAGIVCDGIGGAIRETVTAAPRAYEILEVTPENPHRMIILDTQGMETHTGGTPPNRTLTKQDGKVLYRRDALVAASHLISRLLKAAESRNLKHHIKIIKSAPPKQTGFSTVPSGQEIRLLVSEAAHKQVAYLISYILTDIMEEFDLWGGMKTEEITEGRFQVIFGKDLDAIEIPAVVEQLVREEVNSQILDGKSGFGTVRGTVTDFSMDAEKGTSFKLDLRDVDTGAIASIRGQIHSRIMDLLPAKIEVLDEKPYTPVDGAAAETKKEIARTLGLSTIAMPSLPGHDAASLGRAGIPVTMTFIAHNGISHSPSETITEENYAKAEKLSHAYLESLLF